MLNRRRVWLAPLLAGTIAVLTCATSARAQVAPDSLAPPQGEAPVAAPESPAAPTPAAPAVAQPARSPTPHWPPSARSASRARPRTSCARAPGSLRHRRDLQEGSTFPIIAKSAEWYNVRVSETETGWIHSSLCEEFDDVSGLEFRPNPKIYSRTGTFVFTGYSGAYAFDRKSNSLVLGARLGYYVFDACRRTAVWPGRT